MDLILRADRNDHSVIAGLCAPAGLGLRRTPQLPIGAVVADATVAHARPQLEEGVRATGTAFIVDPQTFLMQDEQPPERGWAALPFAVAEKMHPNEFVSGDVQDEIIDRVITFQRQAGATALVPPYFYARKVDDPWFAVNLSMLQRTARYLEREDISLPVVPVFAGALRQFAPEKQWAVGVDQFFARARDLNSSYVGMSMVWSRTKVEGYDAIAHLMRITQRAAGQLPTISWRQGQYGLATVAAGAAGYETGPGKDERGIYTSMMSNRRPRPEPEDGAKKKSGGGGANVYLSTFGRSIPREAAQILLRDMSTRATLLCPDDSCCPDGADSMVSQWREHAIRSRARQLAELQGMPSASWRLNHIATRAEQAVTDAQAVNDLLHRAGSTYAVPTDSFRNLAQVATDLRAQTSGTQVA